MAGAADAHMVQYDTETRLASQHLGIGIRGALERECFGHGADAAQCAEPERGVARCRVTGQRTGDSTLAEHQIDTGSLDHWTDREHDCVTARMQSLEDRFECFSRSSGNHNQLSPTEPLQRRRWLARRAVDVVMSAQSFRELRLVVAAGDGRDFEAHLSSVLHG